MDEARALAASRRGAMVAAAGCGKTHVLATAVAHHGAGRELVLTHTHAGIDAIRGRLQRLGVPARSYHVDTLAGWACRLAAAFPASSGLRFAHPLAGTDYDAAYAAACKLVRTRPIQEILRASYSGVYVDEYQDCTVGQHALVLALRDMFPCRIAGDPLQGIFDFGDNEQIRWPEHVATTFDAVPGPSTAWRWRGSNPALGDWLQDAREALSNGRALQVERGAPVNWRDAADEDAKRRAQLGACLELAKRSGETVVAIHGNRQQCHSIASRLRGAYSCVEAIDTQDLYDYAARIDESSGPERAVAVLDFAGTCTTKLGSAFDRVRTALLDGKAPRGRKFATQQDALLAVADACDLAPVSAALQVLGQVPDAITYRWELHREMARAVRAVLDGEAATLVDAARLVRNRARRLGRRLPQRAVGTTLLVKGLEFDHAVVLDADALDARNLYVALTRGARSVTLISRSRTIVPVPAPDRRRRQLSLFSNSRT